MSDLNPVYIKTVSAYYGDVNQVAKASQDPLSIHGGSITRSRTKKMKNVLSSFPLLGG